MVLLWTTHVWKQQSVFTFSTHTAHAVRRRSCSSSAILSVCIRRVRHLFLRQRRSSCHGLEDVMIRPRHGSFADSHTATRSIPTDGFLTSIKDTQRPSLRCVARAPNGHSGPLHSSMTLPVTLVNKHQPLRLASRATSPFNALGNKNPSITLESIPHLETQSHSYVHVVGFLSHHFNTHTHTILSLSLSLSLSILSLHQPAKPPRSCMRHPSCSFL